MCYNADLVRQISLPSISPKPYHTAAIWLSDGRIYVFVSQFNSKNFVSSNVYVYIRPWKKTNPPCEESWMSVTPMPSVIKRPSAALLCKDIFVVGDKSAAIYSPSSRLTDANRGQWTSLYCPFRLTGVFGQGDDIFAIGQF